MSAWLHCTKVPCFLLLLILQVQFKVIGKITSLFFVVVSTCSFFFFLNYAAANRWVRRANDVWWADFKVHSLLVRFSFFFFEPRARERIDTWRRITKFVVWPFESRPFCCSFVSCAWEKEMRQTTMGLSVGHSTRSRRHFSSPNGKCGNIQVDSVPACSSRAMALIHSIQIPTTTGQNHNRKKITHIP
jgi:hypothetical protein